MKYYKAKKVIADGTTYHFDTKENPSHLYSNGDVEYIGVNTTEDLLPLQRAEIAAQELTFAEIKPILDSCHLMKTINGMIERKIAEHYSIPQEIKMIKLPETNAERIAYQAYVDECKALFRPMKVEKGLVI